MVVGLLGCKTKKELHVHNETGRDETTKFLSTKWETKWRVKMCVCGLFSYTGSANVKCACVFSQWVNIKSQSLSLCNPFLLIKFFSYLCVFMWKCVHTFVFRSHTLSLCNPMILTNRDGERSLQQLCVHNEFSPPFLLYLVQLIVNVTAQSRT